MSRTRDAEIVLEVVLEVEVKAIPSSPDIMYWPSLFSP
jgi:hypothetical protein